MGSSTRCRRSCWPAVTTSGVLLCHAVTIAPIALPNPGPVCRFTRAACPVPWAYPSAIPKTLASCSPKTYRKSSGKSAKNGSSVEPGLPKTVVIPRSRRRSKVTSRTVAITPYPLVEILTPARKYYQSAFAAFTNGAGRGSHESPRRRVRPDSTRELGYLGLDHHVDEVRPFRGETALESVL